MSQMDVIVPVYNVEPYLRRCVDSILGQTFRDFTLYLIDDGSTDGGGGICDEYAGTDGRVRVIHQENRGLSAARNRGLEDSSSGYVTFIDSDDYVEERYLERLWRMAEEADMVLNGMVVAEEGGGEIPASPAEEPDRWAASRGDAFRYMLGGERPLLFAWGKLYRRDLFQEIRFPAGELFEDVKIMHLLVERASRIVCTSYAGYFYVQRRGSITNRTAGREYLTLLENDEALWTFIRSHYPDLEYLVKRKYFKSCFYLIERMGRNPELREDCGRLRRTVLQNWRYLLFDKTSFPLLRAGTLCLLFGTRFYRAVWRLYARAAK